MAGIETSELQSTCGYVLALPSIDCTDRLAPLPTLPSADLAPALDELLSVRV